MATTISGQKANATRQATWERLLAEPLARRMMLTYLEIGEDRRHAISHALYPGRAIHDCYDPDCPLRARSAEAFCTSLMLDLMGAWCERFGVSIGYFKRFKSRVFEAHWTAIHAADREFTDDDRRALSAFLAA